MSDPLYIADHAALVAFCARLDRCSWLALDTEFVREQTFYPQLCLIQIAIPGQVACIDPLALPSLEPLLERLYDPSITKVLHAAYQDLEIFFYLGGTVPAPVFDTQLAALVLGVGDQLGYAALVKQMLGVELAKAHTRADWRQRPLPPEWLAYAADDVRYLEALYTRQLARLRERGWSEALAEDFQALTDPDRYRPQPQEAWRRIREQHRLRGLPLAVLRSLTAWREEQAIQQDRPRRWILDDAVLVELARRMPATAAELPSVRGLPAAFRRQHEAALLSRIAAAKAEPPERWPTQPRRLRLSAEQTARANQLRELIESRAADYQIAPGALADRRDIESLVLGEESRLRRGWRAAILGKEALARIVAASSTSANTA